MMDSKRMTAKRRELKPARRRESPGVHQTSNTLNKRVVVDFIKTRPIGHRYVLNWLAAVIGVVVECGDGDGEGGSGRCRRRWWCSSGGSGGGGSGGRGSGLLSPRIILSLQKVRFEWFLKRRNGRNYAGTDPLKEVQEVS